MTPSAPNVDGDKAASYDDQLAERLAATVAALVQKKVQRELKNIVFVQGRAGSNAKDHIDGDTLY